MTTLVITSTKAPISSYWEVTVVKTTSRGTHVSLAKRPSKIVFVPKSYKAGVVPKDCTKHLFDTLAEAHAFMGMR